MSIFKIQNWSFAHSTTLKRSSKWKAIPAFSVCAMNTASITVRIFLSKNSSLSNTIWRSICRKHLYRSEIFHITDMLTACANVQHILSPWMYNWNPLWFPSILFFIPLKVLRMTSEWAHITVQTEERPRWGPCQNCGNLERYGLRCCTLNSKVQYYNAQKRGRPEVLELPYFSIQNLNMSPSPGPVSRTHVHLVQHV